MKTRDLSGLFSLAGRSAIVTGGGSGLGLAMAEAFAQYGAAVAVVDLDEATASGVARDIEAAGSRSREPGRARPKVLVQVDPVAPE